MNYFVLPFLKFSLIFYLLKPILWKKYQFSHPMIFFWFELHWYNLSIITWLILGPIENMMNSQSLTRPLGSFFQVVHFSGILRCSMFGDISQITLYRADSADILVRNQNGSRIFEYKNGCCRSIIFLINILFLTFLVLPILIKQPLPPSFLHLS